MGNSKCNFSTSNSFTAKLLKKRWIEEMIYTDKPRVRNGNINILVDLGQPEAVCQSCKQCINNKLFPPCLWSQAESEQSAASLASSLLPKEVFEWGNWGVLARCWEMMKWEANWSVLYFPTPQPHQNTEYALTCTASLSVLCNPIFEQGFYGQLADWTQILKQYQSRHTMQVSSVKNVCLSFPNSRCSLMGSPAGVWISWGNWDITGSGICMYLDMKVCMARATKVRSQIAGMSVNRASHLHPVSQTVSRGCAGGRALPIPCLQRGSGAAGSGAGADPTLQHKQGRAWRWPQLSENFTGYVWNSHQTEGPTERTKLLWTEYH